MAYTFTPSVGAKRTPSRPAAANPLISHRRATTSRRRGIPVSPRAGTCRLCLCARTVRANSSPPATASLPINSKAPRARQSCCTKVPTSATKAPGRPNNALPAACSAPPARRARPSRLRSRRRSSPRAPQPPFRRRPSPRRPPRRPPPTTTSVAPSTSTSTVTVIQPSLPPITVPPLPGPNGG